VYNDTPVSLFHPDNDITTIQVLKIIGERAYRSDCLITGCFLIPVSFAFYTGGFDNIIV
jgi:hypothetical protein